MKQFAVIGLGRFGSSVAKALAEKGQQVLAIDIKEDVVQEISELVTHAVQLDARDEKALRAVGIEQVDVVVVGTATELASSILITLLLKEIGIKEVIAKAITPIHGKVLEKVGASQVIFPEKEMGARVANSLVSLGVVEHIGLTAEYSIFELVAPKAFVGKSLADVEVRAKYDLNVIAIKRKTFSGGSGYDDVIVSPLASEVIGERDILVVIGSNENVEKLKGK